MEEQTFLQTAKNPEEEKGLYVRRGAQREAQLDKLWTSILDLDRGFCFSGKHMRALANGRYLHVNIKLYNHIYNFDLLINLKKGALTAHEVERMEKIVADFNSRNVRRLPVNRRAIGMILCVDKDGNVTSHFVPADYPQIPEYKKVLPTDAELTQMLKQ